jgi:hypothetical protein
VTSAVCAGHGGSTTNDASLTHAVLLSACKGTSSRKGTALSGNWLKERTAQVAAIAAAIAAALASRGTYQQDSSKRQGPLCSAAGLTVDGACHACTLSMHKHTCML